MEKKAKKEAMVHFSLHFCLHESRQVSSTMYRHNTIQAKKAKKAAKKLLLNCSCGVFIKTGQRHEMLLKVQPT